jgi:hypothetical protein
VRQPLSRKYICRKKGFLLIFQGNVKCFFKNESLGTLHKPVSIRKIYFKGGGLYAMGTDVKI